jgi:hypothetical protein
VTAAANGSGSLPTSAANQIYTTDATNTPVSKAVGSSGGLVVTNGQLDINTAVLPRVSDSPALTGFWKYGAASGLQVVIGSGVPASTPTEAGDIYVLSNVAAASAVYVSQQTSTGVYQWVKVGSAGTQNYQQSGTISGGTASSGGGPGIALAITAPRTGYPQSQGCVGSSNTDLSFGATKYPLISCTVTSVSGTTVNTWVQVLFPIGATYSNFTAYANIQF